MRALFPSEVTGEGSRQQSLLEQTQTLTGASRKCLCSPSMLQIRSHRANTGTRCPLIHSTSRISVSNLRHLLWEGEHDTVENASLRKPTLVTVASVSVYLHERNLPENGNCLPIQSILCLISFMDGQELLYPPNWVSVPM